MATGQQMQRIGEVQPLCVPGQGITDARCDKQGRKAGLGTCFDNTGMVSPKVVDSPAIILATLNAKYIHASLGLRYLLANMGELPSSTALREFTIARPPQEVVGELLALLGESPPGAVQVVGFGVYIWNVLQVPVPEQTRLPPFMRFSLLQTGYGKPLAKPAACRLRCWWMRCSTTFVPRVRCWYQQFKRPCWSIRSQWRAGPPAMSARGAARAGRATSPCRTHAGCTTGAARDARPCSLR